MKKETKNFRIKYVQNGITYLTLKDILPEKEVPLNILFVGKTPACLSVCAGHYFQGKHGESFWRLLKQNDILTYPDDRFEDEFLLDHGYGITDIVKVPHNYGNEPQDDEYSKGRKPLLNKIKKYKPRIIVFIYKTALDKLLEFGFKISEKSKYGFNDHLKHLFNSEVFVFPLPGVGAVTNDDISDHLTDLQIQLKDYN